MFQKGKIQMQQGLDHLEITRYNVIEVADIIAGPASIEPQTTPKISRNATLEGLAVELKILILNFAPDLSSLRNIVRSSPLYHRVYLDKREAILSEVLIRDIGEEVLPDALAVHKAFQLPFDGAGGRKDNVKYFITEYSQERRSSSPTTVSSLNIMTLESLSRLQYVVTKIALDFCEIKLAIHPITGEKIQPRGDISPNEKRRIHRAFYRFELFRALFTKPSDIRLPLRSDGRFDATDQWLFDSMDQSFLFLSIFNPWEVEELACVRDYMIKRHTALLQETSTELSKLRLNKDLKDEYWRAENTGYLMSLGLSFLCKLLDTSSSVQKAQILERNLRSDRFFLIQALEEEPSDSVYQTDKFIAAEDGQELLFEGDNVVKGPNAAWTWATNQKVEIMYFEGHKHSLRKWAYVMWDSNRLEDWGILDISPEELFDP